MTDFYTDFEPTARLRLDVEVPPAGLANMVMNPSGEFGAWGWVSPVATSTMSATSTYLQYTSPNPAAASYFYSENMPITAGQYAAASWNIVNLSGYVRVMFEWLNSSLAVIGTSTQTGYLNTTGLNAYGAQLAPANTAYLRLRFDHYSTTGGANPTAGSLVQFKEVTVAKAATSGALGLVRTNLVANPSFETNTTGWAASGSTISRVTSEFFSGAASLRVESNTGGNTASATYTVTGLTVGQVYTVSAYAKGGTSSGFTINNTSPVVAGATWTRKSIQITATSTSSTLYFQFKAPGPGLWTGYIDGVMVEQGATLGSYFDGSTATGGGFTHAWTGTAHASTSTATATTLSFIEPVQYLDVLGPTHSIQVNREELDVGTLTAEVLDVTLDPSQTSHLRPGHKCRLMVLDSGGTWTPAFTGKVTDVEVRYDFERMLLRPNDPLHARITLTAVDAIATLASTFRASGVEFISELPYVLEGAGVPWNANGSGNQVTTATVVSTNDNATALDQVVVTRDTALGTAHVDRFGVLQVRDVPALPNPSFESGITGWSGTTATVAQVSTPTRTGTSALSFTSTGGASSARYLTGTSALPAATGLTYTVSAYVRAASASTAAIQIYWYNAAGTQLSISTGTSTAITTTGWTLVTHTATAPANTRFVTPAIRNPLGTTGAHYVDDVTVSVASAPVTLDETAYSDIDLSFSSKDCINEVMVRNIEWDPGDPTKSIEVSYGPYRDEASIREWGRYLAEYTIHGKSAGEVPTYASQILVANSVPSVRVEAVQLPIKAIADLTTSKALLDLYAQVIVVNATKNINYTLRVTGIEHSITPEGWLMRLTLSNPTTVAVPQVTPRP